MISRQAIYGGKKAVNCLHGDCQLERSLKVEDPLEYPNVISGGKLHMKLWLTWRLSVRDAPESGKILQVTGIRIVIGGMHRWRARHRMRFLLATHRGFKAYDESPIPRRANLDVMPVVQEQWGLLSCKLSHASTHDWHQMTLSQQGAPCISHN